MSERTGRARQKGEEGGGAVLGRSWLRFATPPRLGKIGLSTDVGILVGNLDGDRQGLAKKGSFRDGSI